METSKSTTWPCGNSPVKLFKTRFTKRKNTKEFSLWISIVREMICLCVNARLAHCGIWFYHLGWEWYDRKHYKPFAKHPNNSKYAPNTRWILLKALWHWYTYPDDKKVSSVTKTNMAAKHLVYYFQINFGHVPVSFRLPQLLSPSWVQKI